jgi:stress-induced-phosphoprotein 1
VEPSNAAIVKQLQDVQKKLEESATNPLAGIFNSPDFWSKVTMNPELKEYLKEPDFLQKINDIQRNPNKINEYVCFLLQISQFTDIYKIKE